MISSDEIIRLNQLVEIPLFLTYLGADPATIKELKPGDYRCPAFFRGGDSPHGFACTFYPQHKKWYVTDFTGKRFSNIDLLDFATKYCNKKFLEVIDLMVFCSGKDSKLEDFDEFGFEEKKQTEPIPIDVNVTNQYNFGLHPYLASKNFTPDIATKFKLGWSTIDEMKDRIIIPILDEKNQLVSIQGRAIDERIEPRYKFLKGTGTSAKLSLYNFRDAIKPASEQGYLIVTEGAKSVWRSHQYGYINSVATLSTSVTERQIELLAMTRHYGVDKIIIFFDFDEKMSGQIAAVHLATKLKEKGLDVYLTNIGRPGSPDELTIDQFFFALKNNIKFQ